jgi:hypothetical protein
MVPRQSNVRFWTIQTMQRPGMEDGAYGAEVENHREEKTYG